MCACEGTGIITNDMGMGMYGKHPCSCAAGERYREEHMQRYNAWLKQFNEIYDVWKGEQSHGTSKSIA